MRQRGFGFLLVLVALAISLPALAQEQSGSIMGIVRDSSGGVLPGVTVEARSPQVVGVNTAITDVEGIYRFPALPPGNYTVSATLQGFKAVKIADAIVTLGKTLNVNMTLEVAGVQETIQVTGESPLIDLKQNAAFATIQSETISRIPRGRDFTSVVSTAPGTNNESYAGGIQIDGASGSENRFIVDGMDTSSIRNGTSNKTVLVDFIQEVQVKSSGYNAEFGGATGGVINAVSKSGSNAFHASGGFYYTGQPLRGSVRPTWRINPWTDRGGSFPGDLEQVKARDNDSWNNWNPIVDAGGPLMRDKIWYYAGFSQNRNDYSRTVKYMYSTPVGAVKTFTWYDQQRYFNWNVNTQISNDMRLKVSGAHQWNTNRRGAPAFQYEGSTFTGLTGAAAVLNGQPTDGGWTSATYYSDENMKNNYELTGSNYTNQLFSANLDWVVKPSFFVNVTGGLLYYNTSQPSDFAFDGPRYYYYYSNMSYLPGVIPDDLRHPSGWYNVDKTNNLTAKQYYQRLFFNWNNTLFRTFAGQHMFKFGVRYENLYNEINDGYRGPIFSLYWNSTLNTSDGRNVRGTYGYYRARTFGTFGDAKSNNWALWFQDGWTINNKLTINAGVRTESEAIPAYGTAQDAIKFGFGDKIAPRVGFAYDIKGDGKWKAYGSYGIYYDLMKLGISIMAFGGETWKDWYYTLDSYDWSQIACVPPESSDSGKCGPGTVIESIDYRYNSANPDPATRDLVSQYFGHPVTNTIDPAMKPYRQDEMQFGLDHELTPTMSVGARWIRKRLARAIEDVGVKVLPTADNPSGVEVYFIANPGYGVTAGSALNPAFPNFPTPRAERDYDALEFRLNKRLANNWSLFASYTWSRLYGNYSGLASSDEGGRVDPNTSRYFDAPYMSWTASTAPNLGPLYTDRPHQVKVQATYDFKFGLTAGLNALYQSGMPVGALVTWQGYPVFISSRDSLGRTPFQQRYDLYLQQDIRIKGSHRINLSVNIDNLFDLKTVTDKNQTINRNSLNLDDATFFAGFDPWKLMQQQLAAGKNMRYNPLVVNADGTYNSKPYSYMGRRAFRFMVKYSF